MPPAAARPSDRRARVLGVAGIAILALAAFWPIGRHEFLDWDDGIYVRDNDMVRGGLTLAGLRWAFTALEGGSWHPLTWLSHMLDVQLFGLDAGAHHLTSLVAHLAASLALVIVLGRLTGRVWPGVLVGALFAVHPLHVESVAWLSERKDVLSALFWMLTIAAYERFVRRPARARYLVLIFVFCLALMTKPMVVTLPLVLLILDYWPLGRLHDRGAAPLLREKLPLFALAAAGAVATVAAQAVAGKTVATLTVLPLPLRLANAATSAAAYLRDMVIPRNLAFYYPYPIDGVPPAAIGGAVALLAGCSLLALCQRRARPFLLAGWLWYLVTLLPVIGIVQVGMQARADRYTYLPLVGIFVLLAWGGADLASRSAGRRVAFAAAGVLVALLCAALARGQVGSWRDTETLTRRAIAVTAGNWVAHVNLGQYLMRQGRDEEGLQQYREAAALVPARAERHFQRGLRLAGEGRDREAAAEYARAAELFPPFVMANFSLGLLEARQGDVASASLHLRAAIAYRPDFVEAHFERGVLIAQAGEWEEAAAHFSEVLRYRPDFPGARHNLQVVLEGLGYGPDYVDQFLQNRGGHPDVQRWSAP
ncbi:MAG TPA: tetratricopeptide repeat protein [bacterium]